MADPRLTGILLAGGASVRFGSTKALATFRGETLATHMWRLLGEVAEHRLAVGKQADGLQLGFPVLDDGTDVRAPLAGLVAGLRSAPTEVAVVVPVDLPLLGAVSLRRLAAACRQAAVPQTGPLPGAYRTSALPELERCLREGRLSLRRALEGLEVEVVEVDARDLANVNTEVDLRKLS